MRGRITVIAAQKPLDSVGSLHITLMTSSARNLHAKWRIITCTHLIISMWVVRSGSWSSPNTRVGGSSASLEGAPQSIIYAVCATQCGVHSPTPSEKVGNSTSDKKELAAEAARKSTGVTTAALPSAQSKLAEPKGQRLPTTSHAGEKQAASYEVALGKRSMESTRRAAVRDKTKFVHHAKSHKLADQSNHILTGNYVSFAGKKSIYGKKVNRTKKPMRLLSPHPRCTTKGSA